MMILLLLLLGPAARSVSLALTRVCSRNAAIDTQSDLLARISSKVSEVYLQAGFDNDAKLGTLDMLTHIEHTVRCACIRLSVTD